MSASLAYHTQGIVEFQHHSLWLSPKTEQPNLLCRSKHFSGRGRIVVRGKGRIENPIRSTAQTGKAILQHWDGFLGFRCFGNMTNASMEGFNNKVRTMLRQAYGYRDPEYMRLKIFNLPNNNIKIII